MNDAPILELERVGHAFGGLVVLRDVSFKVPAGGISGLIGPNGSGKTTLFNIASGFLSPKAGAIRLEGRPITRAPVQQRCRAGMVRTFQTPKVFGHMTVAENVAMGLYSATRSGFFAAMLRTPAERREARRMAEAAEAIVERFGLSGIRNTRAGELPAGQQRIVELARARMASPRLLLLDEPSSGLSHDEVQQLREWIEILASEGTTILLVSHDMGLMEVCREVHALYFGKIIASGSMADIQANAAVRDAYLGG
ncbi:ABC transporter ATP-binding protein [Ensifer sp. NM-2]|uniref:ABC transporter ATP-binding protein n=1 Tax=Ensifer sp. NM-2 TaxID=2109730 RepID=UPI000D1290FE|nr:ABC transporter ATP-binding protein [Ensifer sp. NM-2]PSS60594.1 ABC transporter ATP-binding protein [Ensifer sp. NM-2]